MAYLPPTPERRRESESAAVPTNFAPAALDREEAKARKAERKAVESVAPVTGTTRCRPRTAEAVAARGNGPLRAD